MRDKITYQMLHQPDVKLFPPPEPVGLGEDTPEIDRIFHGLRDPPSLESILLAR